MMNGRKWLMILVGVAALVAPASAPAAVPGINVADPSTGAVDAGLATGAKLVRLFVRWDVLEPSSAGQYPAFGAGPAFDAAIQKINAGGAKPVFVIVGAPTWANGSADPLVGPDATKYADFFTRFVQHTASIGSVAAYEIWNEEDAAAFWHGGVSAAAYAALVKQTYAAAKPVAGNAAILLGPTTGNNYAFIDQLYGAGVKGSFDGVAVHTDTACLTDSPDSYYRDSPGGPVGQFTFLGYRSVREVMVAHGDPKPIWMTELGWASTGGKANSCERGASAGKKPSGVTEEQQAKNLTAAYGCLASYDYIAAGLWFTYADTTGEAPDEVNHYGLVHTDGTHKAAYAAFTKVTSENGGAAAACGDFTPPVVKIIAPVEGQTYSSSLLIKASVNDNSGGNALRIRLTADGKSIRSFGDLKNDQVASIDWQGAKSLANGKHTIKVEGFDANGNTSSKTVTVCKGTGCGGTSSSTQVKFSANQPKCSHLKCTLKGRVAGPAGVSIGGKVKAYWQLKRKGKWVTLHKGTKNANKPFTFTQKLKQKGKWRVQVRYLGASPLKASISRYKTFTAKS